MSAIIAAPVQVDNITLQSVNGVVSIKNLGVGTAQLAAEAVTRAKFADGIFTQLFEAESSNAGADAWEDWDLSGVGLLPVGAKLAFFVIRGAGTANVGVRPNGSALTPLLAATSGSFFFVVVELPADDSRIVERFTATNVTRAFFRLVGYI